MSQRALVYLHGFASSPRSSKARFFAERAAGLGWAYTCPDLNEPDFTALTVSRMIDQADAADRGTRRRAPWRWWDRAWARLSRCTPPPGGASEARCRRWTASCCWRPPSISVPSLEEEFGPARMAAWQHSGRLPVFHYGDDAMRELGWDFMPDARAFDSDAVQLDLPILIYQGSGDEVVAPGQRRAMGGHAVRRSRLRLVDDGHQLLGHRRDHVGRRRDVSGGRMMTRAACASALLAVMCLTSPARHHVAASAQASPTASGGLGHRGLADRRRGRPAEQLGAAAPARRARVVSQDCHAGRRVCDRAGLVRHARAVRGRGDREGPDHSLQPSPASPSGSARPKLWPSRATSGLRPVGARLPRARLDGVLAALGLPPTPAGAPMPLVATGLRASPSPPMAWVEALVAPAAAAVGGALVARREGDAGGRAARRGALRHGQRVQRTRARRPGEDRHRATSRPEALWASSSPRGPPSAPDARHRPGRPGVAGKDAADLAAAVVANPPREAEPSAPSAERSEAPPSPPRPAAPSAPPPARSAEPGPLRVGTPRPGGGYDVEAHRARRLRRASAGRRSRGRKPALRRSKRLPWRCGHSPSATAGDTSATALTCARSRTARCADALRGRARCGSGNVRPDSARQRRACVGVLLGVVRRAHRAPVGRLAWRRRSVVPALEVGPGLRG